MKPKKKFLFMDENIKQKIITATGNRNWEEGLGLFKSNAVLDIQKDGKVIEARVANQAGRFERVKVQFKGSAVIVRCTCSRRTSNYCEHAVATLLQLDQEDRKMLNEVFSETRKPNVDIPLPSADDQLPASVTDPVAPVRDLSWENFIETPQSAGQLQIVIKTSAPSLESRWKKLELNITIIYNRRKYSAGNMKQLVEVGVAAGGMKLDDFSVQEQQAMRFLIGNAELLGSRYVLNSCEMADLLHCLSGCSILYCNDGRINIHTEPLELVFFLDSSDDKNSVVPRFMLPGQGVMPAREARPIVGRGGAWIGFGTDYWWLPGLADSAWIRSFTINPPASELTSEKLSQLSAACENRRIPARIIGTSETRELKAEPGVCKPVLTLDWEEDEITASVEFDYYGHRIPIDGPDVLWGKDRFVSRDTERENKALQTLEEMGFNRVEQQKAVFKLADPEKLVPFLDSGFNALDDDWTVYYSTRFSRKQQASGDLNMRVTTGREKESWFELNCEIKTSDDQTLSLEKVLEALREQRQYIQLESGAVARIPESLRYALSFYLEKSNEETEKGFIFGHFSALPVLQASGGYLRSRNTKWQRLCRRLMEPVKSDELEIPSVSLVKCLRDYQKEGVAWLNTLEECGFHGILADEMGLGKTIQALSLLLRRKKFRKKQMTSIIVCPTSLVENWRMEAEKFTPELKAIIIGGPARKKTLSSLKREKVDIAITSYALLRRDIEDYENLKFDYIILDEAQHIKNPETANARTCKSLSGEHRLILTGTPVENSLREVWSLFDFLMPGLLGDRQTFREKYELAAATGTGDTESSRAAELARQIHPFILRRTKQEVCKQLPPKLEHVFYCEFGEAQRRVYNRLVTTGSSLLRKAQNEGWKKNRMELLSILLRLRQTCCHPQLLPPQMLEGEDNEVGSAKTELLKEIILEAIDGNHRMLIFSQFTNMLKIITQWLIERGIRYEYLDGSTKDRQARVENFNSNSSIPVFIISLKAGGTGLNLTGADTVIHYDPWWNPMVEDQATDRTHRIGQENIVTSFKLVARHTIEEKILQLQSEKRELFNQLIGGAPAKLGQLSPEDFEFLLQR